MAVEFVLLNLSTKFYTKNYHFWFFYQSKLLKSICSFTDKTVSLQAPKVAQQISKKMQFSQLGIHIFSFDSQKMSFLLNKTPTLLII